MRFVAWLVVALVVLPGCADDGVVTGPEIPVINPVIGDASFVAKYGRAPTLADDPVDRVRTHLAYVEAQLRATDVSALSPAERAARTRTLDHLRAYWERGQFPASDATAALLPTFVDDTGVRCAVAYLAEQDLGAAPILDINHRYRNAYIAQIDAPALLAWATTSGLTRAELAMIQPAYPPPPPRHGVDVAFGVVYQYAAAQHAEPAVAARGAPDEDAPLGSVVAARTELHWHGRMNPRIGVPLVVVSGSLGWADPARVAYDAHLRLGSELAFRDGHIAYRVGGTAGIGVDAIGDRIAPALTVPVDGYFYAGPQRSSLRFGVLGGPRFGLTSDRGIGWRGALGLIVRDVWHTSEDDFHALRDVHLEVGIERIADATFIGLTLSAASRAAFGWWDRS